MSLNAAELPRNVVAVEGGTIEGVATSNPGVRVFKGIPYAAPPVGELRWKEPQPVVKWTGTRKADQFGPRCTQPKVSAYMMFRDSGNSEDCLYLNVWTPAKSASDKLPVIFWIHGGSFLSGASSEPQHDGEVLATRGVIVVSINYRLGIFGFFAHPDLTKESAHHTSGNYGLLDQWAALRWVRDNIRAFGGDPDRITVFGESAGSFSISALMASPLSRDLIAGAIGESGAFFGPTFAMKPLSSGEAMGARLATKLSADLPALRAMPADKLTMAALRAEAPAAFIPVVDGYFFPAPVSEVFAAGKQSHVPLLAGWNGDEMPFEALLGKDKMTRERLAARFREKYGSEADSLQEAYAAGSDQEALQAARDLAGDEFIGYSTWKWIDAQARTGGKPVYRYLFTRVRPPKPGAMLGPVKFSDLGAIHASEIEYVFGTLDSDKEFVWQPEDYKVSELMQAYWTNFAKNGDPNGPGLPKWTAYRHVMRLDVDAGSAPESHRDRYEALDRFHSRPAAN